MVFWTPLRSMPTMKYEIKQLGNSTFSISSGPAFLRNWKGSSTCNHWMSWTFTLLSNWQRLNPAQERKANLPLKSSQWRTMQRIRLMLLTSANRKPPTRHFDFKTGISVATTGERPATGVILTPGGIQTNSNQGITPPATSRFVFSARFRIIAKKNVASASTPTSRASTPMVALSGRMSMPLLKPTQVRTLHLSSPLWIFNFEFDGTPTSSSIRHSANNYEFVYHLHCNL